ncbi:MAG: DUF4124 domain-containing protein [Steroidobacteraceae bacterium]
MLQKLLVTLLMAGLSVIASADTFYKWSDSHGQIHYTDLPPTQSDAKVLGVFHQESAVMDDESGGDEGDGNDNGDNSNGPTTLPSGNDNSEPAVDSAAVAAVNADVARSKNKQCKEAQDRYQRYIESRRLFRETSDGKREYLTDQELNEARVRAKQSVDESCG